MYETCVSYGYHVGLPSVETQPVMHARLWQLMLADRNVCLETEFARQSPDGRYGTVLVTAAHEHCQNVCIATHGTILEIHTSLPYTPPYSSSIHSTLTTAHST